MPRPKGSKNRKTIVKQVEQAMGVIAPDLSSLHVLEATMAHFFTRAMVLQRSGGNKADIDADLLKAAMIAEKVAPYRFAKLSAVKLAGDPNNPIRIKDEATAAQLRTEILTLMAELQEAGVLDLEALPAPQRQIAN
jgi:hypothetical protein